MNCRAKAQWAWLPFWPGRRAPGRASPAKACPQPRQLAILGTRAPKSPFSPAGILALEPPLGNALPTHTPVAGRPWRGARGGAPVAGRHGHGPKANPAPGHGPGSPAGQPWRGADGTGRARAWRATAPPPRPQGGRACRSRAAPAPPPGTAEIGAGAIPAQAAPAAARRPRGARGFQAGAGDAPTGMAGGAPGDGL